MGVSRALCRWAIGLALLLWGCHEPRPICEGDSCRWPVQVTQELYAFGVDAKVDVLFVVDDSASGPLGGSLAAYLPRFMEPLEHLYLPVDLHVGVITADLGAGAFTPPWCARSGGDDAALQNQRAGVTCSAASLGNPADRFLVLDECWEGYEEKNFAGTLGDAFGCHAAVPAAGCGIVQPLAAMRAALEGCGSPFGCSQPLNEGFLRPDAFLLVVILASQDDCSMPADSALFDPSQTALGSELGPLTPYRCFEFGTLCGDADPGRSPGPRQGCVPGSKDSRYGLTPVEEFASFLKALKPQDPRMVSVSVIAGPPRPVVVGADADGNPALQPSCTGAMAEGSPGIRLAQFVTKFDADRATFVAVCEADLNRALEQVTSDAVVCGGARCLFAPPSDREPDVDGLQLDAVAEVCRWLDFDRGVKDCQTLPACAPAVCEPAAENEDCSTARHDIPEGAPGCWYVWRDESACPLAHTSYPYWVGSGYRFEVDWGGSATCVGRVPPPDTTVGLQYVSCGADPGGGDYDCSPGCASLWPRCCANPTPGCYP